ncbi:MAG: hypothetical protein J5I47_01855 [Vicingus serpentipes]|nr:hypothetical protein [Vicingus serpentipes]
MLIIIKNPKTQRFSDQLFFFDKESCDFAEGILTTDCIHLYSKKTAVFLTEEESKKIEVLYELLKECSLEQIKKINNSYTQPSKTILSSLNDAFEKRFGWFFKNGNK